MDQQGRFFRTIFEENGVIHIAYARWNAARIAYEIYVEQGVPYEANNTNYPRMSQDWAPSMVYVSMSRYWRSRISVLDDHYNQNQILGRGNHETQQQHSFQNLEKIRIEEGAQGSEPMMCSICLGELSVGTEVIRLPNPCSHVYHQDCIMKWLNRSNTCPMCRRPI